MRPYFCGLTAKKAFADNHFLDYCDVHVCNWVDPSKIDSFQGLFCDLPSLRVDLFREAVAVANTHHLPIVVLADDSVEFLEAFDEVTVRTVIERSRRARREGVTENFEETLLSRVITPMPILTDWKGNRLQRFESLRKMIEHLMWRVDSHFRPRPKQLQPSLQS